MAFVLGLNAQDGIEFEASIDIDFNDVETVQVPASPIQTQVLFSGSVDSVTWVDTYGNVGEGLTPAREGHDFIGITPVEEGVYTISVNHETSSTNPKLGDGGGMTVFTVERDADSLKLIESKVGERTGTYHNVDFANTVGETWTNCGGIIAPDGRIWTAEEYPIMER